MELISTDMKWYVLQAYSGYENKVKQSLEDMIKREGLEDSFGEILVPTEEVLEIKEGQKKRSERKYFPGYVMIKMDLNDNTWHKVKSSPKVLGFVGGTSDWISANAIISMTCSTRCAFHFTTVNVACCR